MKNLPPNRLRLRKLQISKNMIAQSYETERITNGGKGNDEIDRASPEPVHNKPIVAALVAKL